MTARYRRATEPHGGGRIGADDDVVGSDGYSLFAVLELHSVRYSSHGKSGLNT
jgi:hypothetical protein